MSIPPSSSAGIAGDRHGHGHGHARPLVVDAPLLIKLVLPEELADRAQALIAEALGAGRPLYAPPSAIPDIAEAIHNHLRRERLTAAEADSALAILGDLPLHAALPPGYWASVLGFAREHRLRHLAPAQAIVLADRLGGDAWTGHRETYDGLRRAVPWLHWVGDAGAGIAT